MGLITLPWVKARQRQEALDSAREKAFLSALDAVVKVTTAQAEALTAAHETLRTYLEMFKTPTAPEAVRPQDDYSELLSEAQRLLELKEAGFPIDLSQVEQLKWVQARADFTPDLLT